MVRPPRRSAPVEPSIQKPFDLAEKPVGAIEVERVRRVLDLHEGRIVLVSPRCMAYNCRIMGSGKTRALADGELEVLKALWEVGSGPVRDVRAYLAANGRELAYNTVQTVLGRLVEKDLVARDSSTTPHRFRPRVTRERFRRDRVRDLLGKVFDGASGGLALQLVRQGRLSEDESDELQRALDERKRGRADAEARD